jgi:hypothetical protein
MKRSFSLALAWTLAIALISPFLIQAQEPKQPAPPQQTTASPLTNKDVVEMLKSGLSADIVIAKIRTSQNNFDTSPAALSDLKAGNVPEAVILEMVKGPTETTQTASTPATDVTVTVPDGTEIEIQLTNNASGEELKVGDVVDFTLVRPVLVNGVTVFEKDAAARARITTAKRAGHWGKAGKLEWAMQDVMSVDGNRVSSRFTQRQVGDSKGGTVAVAAVATTVLLGPLGLLWGLKKGKPSIIAAGNRYSVFVNGDTKIKGKASAEALKAQ